jgi:hypothetical protein
MDRAGAWPIIPYPWKIGGAVSEARFYHSSPFLRNMFYSPVALSRISGDILNKAPAMILANL